MASCDQDEWPILGSRYLLVSPIPYFQSESGAIWLDRLWHRDLVGHFPYLSDLVVVAPRVSSPDPDMLEVVAPPGVSARFVGLPHSLSFASAVAQVPHTFRVLYSCIRASDIVHSGVGGWPYPLGLIANPLAVLLRKKLIVVVESSFWRVADPARASVKARLRAGLTEAFARWSVRAADLSIFTSVAYRDSLDPGRKGRSLINAASWIHDDELASESDALVAWTEKGDELRLLYAGRLTVDKGVRLLLGALLELDRAGVTFALDIMGQGPLRAECESLARGFSSINVRVLEPLPYGVAFLSYLRRFHALVVPTLSDEQPRVIYDAFSQAVPVVASDTGGNRDAVIDGKSGSLFTPGNTSALATALSGLCGRTQALREMGLHAHAIARGHTHRTMHHDRAKVLSEIFGSRHLEPK